MIWDVAEEVLSELDDEGVEQYGDNWQDSVLASLEYLEGHYGNQNLLNPGRELADYGSLSTQAAYVYAYAVGHADFAYQLLRSFRKAEGKPLLDCDGTLRVASLGGGPGSELIGLAKYLSQEGVDEGVTSIVYTVIDKEEGWAEIAAIVTRAVSSALEIPIELIFLSADMTDVEACEELDLSDQHLLIMSFFVAEISVTENSTEIIKSVRHLMRSLPTGSKLLYNDSRAASFLRFFNARARVGFNDGWEVEKHLEVEGVNYFGVLEAYLEATGRHMKLSSNAVAKFLTRL